MKIVNKHSRSGFFKLGLGFLVVTALFILILIAFQSKASSILDSNLFLSILPNASQDNLPSLIIDMPFDQYNRILSQRERALDQGVVIASNNDFVRADIRFQDTLYPVELRLQQGVAKHLEDGDKWNFDGRTRDEQQIAGMQRFYLIDPADNNWLQEAAYMEALKNEGLLASQYFFVHLFFNGQDKGIYVLQEGFGQEIITGSDRQEGVILEFDSTPLWKSIANYDGNLEAMAQDPISNISAADLQYFQVDTFRDAAIADNPVLTEQKNQAIGLLRGLQSGELMAGEVFDIEKYGRFLALADLWGAIDGTSLVNLRYYFNPQSQRLEPVGFNGNPLSSNRRLDLAAVYGDIRVQESYIGALQRMSNPDYIAELQEDIEPKLQNQVKALQSEIEIQMPWEPLRARQDQIRHSLTPVQPLLAYLGPPELAQDGIIQVEIANALNVAVQIMGFNLDGATFLPMDPKWIQNGSENLIIEEGDQVFLNPSGNEENYSVRYVRVHIPLTEIMRQDNELDFMHEPDIQIAARIIGLDNVTMVSTQTGYPEPVFIPQESVKNE